MSKIEKVAIVYFSGTGNTKIIADKMKDAILKTNRQVDLINIENDRIIAREYDYLIIGGPVYVERYPEILLRYIEENINGFKGKCMMYSTQALDGLTPVFKHAIKRLKTINVTYYNYITMPNNFYLFMFKKFSKVEEQHCISVATNKIENMIADFFEQRYRKYDISNMRVIIAESIYKVIYPFCTKLFMNKFKLDKDKCIKCKKCENNCPVQSIKIEPKLKFSKKCTLCQRCIHECPQNAFLYKGKEVVQYKLNFK